MKDRPRQDSTCAQMAHFLMENWSWRRPSLAQGRGHKSKSKGDIAYFVGVGKEADLTYK